MDVYEESRTDILPVSYPGRVGVAWTSRDEISFLVESTPLQGTVLEIGSASGVTASVIAEMRPDARVVSVDSYPVSPPSDSARSKFPDWEHVERMNNWRRNRRENQSLFIGDISQLNRICCAKFDWIFIDGGHLFDEVFSDLCVAEKMLSDGGLLFCHDFHDPNWFQVTEAITRFCERSDFVVDKQVGSIAVLGRRRNE